MIKIFTDCDGTITLQVVGDAMFERFGGPRCKEFINEYREGKISAVECFRRESALCNRVRIADVNAFLDSREIDRSFIEFAGYCRQKEFDCTILSDGMDYYIQRILDKHGIGSVPFYANVLNFIPVSGTEYVAFDPEFPYTDEACQRCACCKRNRLLALSGDDDVIVYVGEGYSDRCPVRYADVVFAKDDLLGYCRAENISCYEYRSFADIRDRMNLLERNGSNSPGLRKRRQAERLRRDVFIGE